MTIFSRQKRGGTTTGKPTIVPVSYRQQYLLDQHVHPDCTDDLRQMWVLTHVTLVKPKLDQRRLNRALVKIFARHDSLRIQFDRINGKWRGIIAPPGPVETLEIDAIDLDPAQFHAAVVEATNQPMPLINSPMAEIVLVRGGKNGDAVIVRVHHAISDGFGMVVLIEDLFKALLGVPFLAPAISHADYVSKYQYAAADREAEIKAFWDDMHRDFPPAPTIGRIAKGKAPLTCLMGVRQRNLYTIELTKRGEDRTAALSSKLNLSAPTILFAAHYQAMCECYDTDRIPFLSHITRTDPRLNTFMGDHTADALLIYTRAERSGFEAAIKDLGQRYIQAMTHLPSNAARLGSLEWQRIIDQGGIPTQFSAYQPRAIARENRSMLKQGFRSAPGTEVQAGPYILSTMDAELSNRISFDLQIRVDPLASNRFIMAFDGMSFEKHEISRLGEVMCELLEADMTKATFS